MTKRFYGWWIIAASFITFGLSVGLPYYNLGFFYDYYTKPVAQGGFGWTRPEAVLGFPLAAIFTIWVGPLIMHRFPPRYLILVGTGLTLASFVGFANMGGSLFVYYGIFFLYTVAYILSGPIPHQVIVSQWFRKRRGFAMGLVYVGVGTVGALGSYMVRYVTAHYGFRTALMAVGVCVMLAWPLAILVLRNKPSEVGQFPDGDSVPPAENKVEPKPFSFLLHRRDFWLLAIGSVCSIGSIGSVNFLMKFVFRDQGYANQTELDSIWTTANAVILWSSIGGRVFVGWGSDKFSKKWVMTATYLLVAITIPVLLLCKPTQPEFVYLFAVLFGFGMGADYMLIPLMAAEQFGVNTLARAMAIILPFNTIGQTWLPYGIARLADYLKNYTEALMVVFAISFLGAISIALLPKKTVVAEVEGAEAGPAIAQR
jgi:sugar phosphate permease